jgi:hypothetical protein
VFFIYSKIISYMVIIGVGGLNFINDHDHDHGHDYVHGY